MRIMMNIIKFAKQFLKLHGQTSAELVAVRLVDTALMSYTDFDTLVEYDCKATDSSYYPLNKDKTYTQLIFIGNKNIPFATLRNKDKYMDYVNMIGHIFCITIQHNKHVELAQIDKEVL